MCLSVHVFFSISRKVHGKNLQRARLFRAPGWFVQRRWKQLSQDVLSKHCSVSFSSSVPHWLWMCKQTRLWTCFLGLCAALTPAAEFLQQMHPDIRVTTAAAAPRWHRTATDKASGFAINNVFSHDDYVRVHKGKTQTYTNTHWQRRAHTPTHLLLVLLHGPLC